MSSKILQFPDRKVPQKREEHLKELGTLNYHVKQSGRHTEVLAEEQALERQRKKDQVERAGKDRL